MPGVTPELSNARTQGTKRNVQCAEILIVGINRFMQLPQIFAFEAAGVSYAETHIPSPTRVVHRHWLGDDTGIC